MKTSKAKSHLTPDQVKQLRIWMIENDVRQVDIARERGISRVSVNQVVNGLRGNPILLEAIVSKCGRTVQDLKLPEPIPTEQATAEA